MPPFERPEQVPIAAADEFLGVAQQPPSARPQMTVDR